MVLETLQDLKRVVFPLPVSLLTGHDDTVFDQAATWPVLTPYNFG